MRSVGAMRRAAARTLATLAAPAFVALAVAAGSAAAIPAPARGEPQESRAAVVLYDPQPLYPTAAAGSDISPEATVRVEVDEEGRVNRVDILRIEPPSRFDDAFRRALEETFRTWRFAPRIENGQPVATELQWTTKLYGPGGSGGYLGPDERWDQLLGIRRRDGLSYLELPYEQRVKLLEERVRTGLAAFAGTAVQEHSTDWFVVRTSLDSEVASVVANNLQALYGVLYSMLGETIPLHGERLKVQVFAYESARALDYLKNDWLPDESSAAGFYSSLGLIALRLDMMTSEHALSLLLHEGTHAFVDRHVVRPGVQLPYWLSEGFAEYIANSTIRKGELIPGKVPRARRANVRMIHGRIWVERWDPRASLTLGQIKQAAKRGEALSLVEMLDAGQGDFLGEELGLYYGMSWLLVHYLRHGREGWAESEFPEFFLYVGEGYPVLAAFETVYGHDASELEESFRSYIAAF